MYHYSGNCNILLDCTVKSKSNIANCNSVNWKNNNNPKHNNINENSSSESIQNDGKIKEKSPEPPHKGKKTNRSHDIAKLDEFKGNQSPKSFNGTKVMAMSSTNVKMNEVGRNRWDDNIETVSTEVSLSMKVSLSRSSKTSKKSKKHRHHKKSGKDVTQKKTNQEENMYRKDDDRKPLESIPQKSKSSSESKIKSKEKDNQHAMVSTKDTLSKQMEEVKKSKTSSQDKHVHLTSDEKTDGCHKKSKEHSIKRSKSISNEKQSHLLSDEIADKQKQNILKESRSKKSKSVSHDVHTTTQTSDEVASKKNEHSKENNSQDKSRFPSRDKQTQTSLESLAMQQVQSKARSVMSKTKSLSPERPVHLILDESTNVHKDCGSKKSKSLSHEHNTQTSEETRSKKKDQNKMNEISSLHSKASTSNRQVKLHEANSLCVDNDDHKSKNSAHSKSKHSSKNKVKSTELRESEHQNGEYKKEIHKKKSSSHNKTTISSNLDSSKSEMEFATKIKQETIVSHQQLFELQPNAGKVLSKEHNVNPLNIRSISDEKNKQLHSKKHKSKSNRTHTLEEARSISPPTYKPVPSETKQSKREKYSSKEMSPKRDPMPQHESEKKTKSRRHTSEECSKTPKHSSQAKININPDAISRSDSGETSTEVSEDESLRKKAKLKQKEKTRPEGDKEKKHKFMVEQDQDQHINKIKEKKRDARREKRSKKERLKTDVPENMITEDSQEQIPKSKPKSELKTRRRQCPIEVEAPQQKLVPSESARSVGRLENRDKGHNLLMNALDLIGPNRSINSLETFERNESTFNTKIEKMESSLGFKSKAKNPSRSRYKIETDETSHVSSVTFLEVEDDKTPTYHEADDLSEDCSSEEKPVKKLPPPKEKKHKNKLPQYDEPLEAQRNKIMPIVEKKETEDKEDSPPPRPKHKKKHKAKSSPVSSTDVCFKAELAVTDTKTRSRSHKKKKKKRPRSERDSS